MKTSAIGLRFIPKYRVRGISARQIIHRSVSDGINSLPQTIQVRGNIKSARDESEDAINEYSALKKQGKIEKLIITGCYNELGKQNLQELFPEVDAFVSIKDNFQIASVIANLYNEKLVCNKDDKSRLLTTPQFAYLKISDGCDNFCSYCKLPYIRGRYKSEPLADLVEEVNNLASSGVTELIIVAQDVTRYGSDFQDGTTLITLLKELSIWPEDGT